ncbi:hypothetical protein [Streptomyces clavifer]|uniref:hypothetical protein n=1 Tax=Streptomyces clavifer TaxID=68188 RepID=UPI00309301C0|nr:hypothetical protein OG388_28195 [Streptomyces clavifer]
MKEQRTVIRGELGHDAKVTSLDAVAKLPTASVEDCVDLSKWQTIDTRTNKVLPLPMNQPRRYVATATAEKWPNGWMVTDCVPDRHARAERNRHRPARAEGRCSRGRAAPARQADRSSNQSNAALPWVAYIPMTRPVKPPATSVVR